jgi:PTS system nitrogen regulatory IIA component
MTLSEVADYLRIAEKTVLRMVHKREIPCARVGSQWRFLRTVIDDWLLAKMRVIPQNDMSRLIEEQSDIVPLSRLVKEEFISLGIKPGTKEEVLSQLTQPLMDHGVVSDGTALLRKLMQRESMASTAIGRGIAVPHIRNPRENPEGGPILCIGVCKEGTDFKALDGGKTHLFFLLYTNSEVVHLRVMGKLISVLRNEKLVSSLIEAGSKEVITGLILKEDQDRKLRT